MAPRNARRLLNLVDTLLDFFRLEACLLLRVDCPALPALVWVDRGRWEKILSNALKHTRLAEFRPRRLPPPARRLCYKPRREESCRQIGARPR